MSSLLDRARAAVLLVWNNITIEPVVMLYLTAYGLNEVRSELIKIGAPKLWQKSFIVTVLASVSAQKLNLLI